MESISRDQFKSRKEWEDYVWEKLIAGLAKDSSSQDIENTLQMFITEYEKKQIIKRVAAVSLLKQGKTYREIGDLLWLSHPTISTIKKSLRSGEGYVSYYRRTKTSKKERRPKETQLRLSVLLDLIFTLPPPPSRPRPNPKKYILPHGKLVFPQRRR